MRGRPGQELSGRETLVQAMTPEQGPTLRPRPMRALVLEPPPLRLGQPSLVLELPSLVLELPPLVLELPPLGLEQPSLGRPELSPVRWPAVQFRLKQGFRLLGRREPTLAHLLPGRPG